MTYGWMLLVVLIVGALVFSFVDFGSLLPNKVDISTQSIKGDSANSAAFGSTYLAAADQDKVYIAFTYTGGQKSTIAYTDLTLVTNLGDTCLPINVKNERLNLNSNATSVTGINYLSGHPGMITFDCPTGTLGALLSGDVIEGTVTVGVKDSTRGAGARAIPNAGGFRLSIQ